MEKIEQRTRRTLEKNVRQQAAMMQGVHSDGAQKKDRWNTKKRTSVVYPHRGQTIQTDSYDQPVLQRERERSENGMRWQILYIPDDRRPDRDPHCIHTANHATTVPLVSLLDPRAAAAVEGRVVTSVGAVTHVVRPLVGEEARVDAAAARPTTGVCSRR